MSDSKPRALPLLLVAAALTLVVTLLRLVGERQGWDPNWFSTEPGSPLNPFGIVWLVPVFGFLLGRRLAAAGKPPFVASFFVPAFGFVAMVGAGVFVLHHFDGDELKAAMQWLWIGSPCLALLALFAWPRAFFATLAYGLMARVPVALVQYFDVEHGWQTHYGKVHPKLVGMDAASRHLFLAMAQATQWLPFTILAGTACAALGAATVRRS
ncbi:MAG: hypothetical protein JNL12_01120 [Planctomycetes bacterium]|nr:hypothetical protein [Planctomycetota bacterium]